MSSRSHALARGLALCAATGLLAACGGSPAATKAAASTPAAPHCASVSEGTMPAGATAVEATNNKPVQLIHGHTLAEAFSATSAFQVVAPSSPTWITTNSGYTLMLRKGSGLTGQVLACAVYHNVQDNSWVPLQLAKSAPAGTYTLEMLHPSGTAQHACPGHTTLPNCASTPKSGRHGGFIGWWANGTASVSGAKAMVDGKPVQGTFLLEYAP